MDSLNMLGFGLLGHSGFMDRLIVTLADSSAQSPSKHKTPTPGLLSGSP
jgi:hypothetical protein